MKKWPYFLLLVCFFPQTAKTVYKSSQEQQAMAFVKLVQKRYYLIQRLEKPMHILFSFYQERRRNFFSNLAFLNGSDSRGVTFFLLEHGIAKTFDNRVVQDYVQASESAQKPEPIKKLWVDFLSYKFIDDDTFVRETILLVLMLYKNMLAGIGIYKDPFFAIRMSKNTGYCSVDQLLDVLDISTQTAQLHSNCGKDKASHASFDTLLAHEETSHDIFQNFQSILGLLDEEYDNANFIISNNMRFYHIKRLIKSIVVLQGYDQLSTVMNNKLSIRSAGCFEDECIRKCIALIDKTQSLKPIFSLWKEFISYKYIGSSVFLRDLVRLIFIVEHSLLSDTCHKRAFGLDGIEELDGENSYEAVSAMSLPELLDKLDIIAENLLEIMQAYELNSHLSWRDWFVKYWWMPPAVLASCLLIFLDKKYASVLQL